VRGLWSKDTPAFDCVWRGHLWVEHSEAGAWPTSDGAISWASWCPWCGTGVSNEQLPDEPEETDHG
jgi:hypothetical protein